MEKDRLAAFSDGVIAIIITIMVLELKAPHGAELSVLQSLVPAFFSYVLSFIYVAIYWNNHHHMMHTVRHVNGLILWANIHLLFWLSLIPFTTAWMGENHFQPMPTAVYGMVLLMAAAAYSLLEHVIIRTQGPNSILKKAIGNDLKGKVSLALYLTGIGFAFHKPWVSDALYALIAGLWIVPDSRIERLLRSG